MFNFKIIPTTHRWVGQEWEECSVSCGVGIQSRTITCMEHISRDLDIKMPEIECIDAPVIPKHQVS